MENELIKALNNIADAIRQNAQATLALAQATAIGLGGDEADDMPASLSDAH